MYRQSKKAVSALFIGPAIVILVAITIYPFIHFIRLSFSEWILISGTASFVGINNFLAIFRSSVFWHSLRITLIFTVCALFLEHGLGFSLAVLLKKAKRSGMIVPFLCIPMVFPPIVTAVVWRIMYNPSFGIINYFLSLVGIPPQSWHFGMKLVLPSLIIIDAWQWSPFVMLVILSGLNAMPDDIVEAAKIDGASGLRMLIHITLPLLKSFILVSMMFRLIYLLTTFDLIAAMTEGGPGDASLTLYYLSYRNAFKFIKLGYGASISFILFLVTLGISMILVNTIRKKA